VTPGRGISGRSSSQMAPVQVVAHIDPFAGLLVLGNAWVEQPLDAGPFQVHQLMSSSVPGPYQPHMTVG
jgi:hypothetical protein